MSDFNLIGGVGVMGYLSPMDTRDTYPVIDPIYGIDGLRNVDTIEDLISISEERRRAGMIVGVSGGTVYYKLKQIEWVGDITDWELFTLGQQETVSFVDKETPLGIIDGINNLFILSNLPDENSEHIYLNGLLQDSGQFEDYTIIGNEIYFNQPPLNGMKIRCSYRCTIL
jgi:hypothetical protein